MKKLICLTTLLAAVVLSGQASAHGAKPRHGGIVNSAGDLSFELVHKGGKAVIYVDDHGAELATTGASGSMTLLSGTSKSEAVLQPGGKNTLVSKTDVQFAHGTKAIATITLPGREPISVRFANK